jgi:hypothetical protein
MTQLIAKHQVASSMVRGFFEGFITGLIDSDRESNQGKPTPQLTKQLIAEHFEHINEYFFHVMFPLLIAINFDDYEQAVADMHRRKFSDATPQKMLLRYASGSKPLFDHIVDEYKRQMYSLLDGHKQSMADHIAQRRLNITKENDAQTVDVGRAIRAMVRSTMHAYAVGLKASGKDKAAFHQPSVLRMMAEGAATLLHSAPFDVWADMDTVGLDGVYRRASISNENYETLINEMNLAYEDLAEL